MFPRFTSRAPRTAVTMVARRRVGAMTAALVVLCAALCAAAAQQGGGTGDADSLTVVSLAGPSPVRNVYFVRHGEAVKNTVDHPDPQRSDLDRLTELGRQQALNTGRRMSSVPVNAVISAPEQRCRDTALAITLYRPFPMLASVDGSLTSKAYETETPQQRASRGVAAVNRFLGATSGDVMVVSHGHLVELMAAKLTGIALAGDVLKREMVNAGVKHMRLDTKSGRWSLVASDATVYDD